ncbi:hypothetical protein N7523_005680 [Penicillium sp. IBT 18751x]|nr:hypothetical protein N7523_005680 [Penicillium sp. IBT 18751x]
MPSTKTLDSLPFDILYQIVTSLDDCDCMNLSRTNRKLNDLMEDDGIMRKIVKNHLLHSNEGQSAWAAQTGFRKAVKRRFDIHEAIATATPYAVFVLGFGTNFLYNEGVLCYCVGQEIRLLHVHRTGRQERVVSLCNLICGWEFGAAAGLDVAKRVTLLQYSDGIVSFRVKRGNGQDDALLAIDTDHRPGQSRTERLLLQEDIPEENIPEEEIPVRSPIFVRHSRSYLWYGVYTSANDLSGVWSVSRVDLATSKKIKFSRDRNVAGDLGKTLCAEIYQEHLYVISTQVASDDDEPVDSDGDEHSSSFYHWFCYSPSEKAEKWSGRLWRREHLEGVIDDTWTDLSIRTDETSGRPVITECRREYSGGKSEHHRTNYVEPLPLPKEAENRVYDDLNGPIGNRQPYNQRPKSRLRRNYHAEHEHDEDATQRREFMASRTKHCYYQLASATFVDLVNDPVPLVDSFRTQDRLRLRTVSRKRKSPIDDEGTDDARKLVFHGTKVDSQLVEDFEDRFVSSGVQLWPREDTPPVIHQILCPGSDLRSMRAVSDERSIIYSVSCAGLPPGHQALILISFDPAIRFPNLESLPALKSPITLGNIFPVELPRPESATSSRVQEVKPLYQAINCSYWLR